MARQTAKNSTGSSNWFARLFLTNRLSGGSFWFSRNCEILTLPARTAALRRTEIKP